jgi:hypothetical protein
VEAAKALYRAEKEKYLREREERKKARDRKASGYASTYLVHFFASQP